MPEGAAGQFEKGAAVRLDKVSFSYGEAQLVFDVEFAAGEFVDGALHAAHPPA